MQSSEHAAQNTPALPERVGTVRITGRIGHGAMGEVLQGYDEELGRPVAVKVLAYEPDEEARERFDREALALARLTHPNVVAVYTKGILDGRPYFTMELVDGPTVLQILESQGAFTLDEAWEIIRQAATGLRSAADAGVTHRDVKPANLLVAKDGTVKVADFGVCKISGRTPAMTEDGTTLGTPFYMAPEQARGEAVDHRADQYSLGATLFHLVTGTPPFQSTQTMAQLMAHQKEPVPDIRARCPDVPRSVADVLQRMMAKKADDRFATYDAMVDAMEDALHTPPSRITRAACFTVRKTPVRLISTWSCQSFSERSRTLPPRAMPALATAISSRPISFTQRFAASWTCSFEATFVLTINASRPNSRTIEAVCSAPSVSISAMQISAPSRASRSAVPRPMPDPAPVMSATLPSSVIVRAPASVGL